MYMYDTTKTLAENWRTNSQLNLLVLFFQTEDSSLNLKMIISMLKISYCDYYIKANCKVISESIVYFYIEDFLNEEKRIHIS